jgi:L-aminopeptidase/D-esterase-like protein
MSVLQGSLLDVGGLSVGHWTSPLRPTGCTVVLCPQGGVCGVDVRGAAPGTRETDLLRPENLVQEVHAVLLCGGSAFGLDAASGVMRWLEERGHGLAVGEPSLGIRVPIVPAAVLFDLFVGDHRIRPDAHAGYAACEAAATAGLPTGRVGAGAGARVGKFFGPQNASLGGVGSASLQAAGYTVGALIAVNAMGDVIDPTTGQIVAGAVGADGSFLDTIKMIQKEELPAQDLRPKTAFSSIKTPIQASPGSATTIGVIATDAPLTKAQATKVAQMAHDGLARSIRPVHTPFDGDTLFCLSTSSSQNRQEKSRVDDAALMVIGAMAAEAVARAVLCAVRV